MNRPSGFKGFTFMALGQLISISGTAMTQLALSFWVWDKYGMATPFSIMNVLFFGASVTFTLLAGSLVDRWPRKLSIILPDLASGILTLIALALYVTNSLSLSYLYVMSLINGIFSAFQFPAYSVAMSAMLKKEEYARANALFSISEAAPALVAPILAGTLLKVIGLEGVMTIDVVTFVLAILVVMWIHIPDTRSKHETAFEWNRFKSDLTFGFRYIRQRKPLLLLLTVFLLTNFFDGFGNTLFAPYILARTNSNPVALGTVQSFFGIGGLLGGILLSVWSVPGRKVYGLLAGIAISAAAIAVQGVARSILIMCPMAILISFGSVLANSHSQAIWQSIVPIELQGRVFSARRFIAQALSAIPMFLSGPIVDYVLTPVFSKNNVLTLITGYGKAGAIGFLIAAGGVLSLFVIAWSLTNTTLLHVEDLASPVTTVPVQAETTEPAHPPVEP
ncbi:MFS transporter [Coprothermobacteraceae bacterium]|nr:MFS transporter [Coprothermobacteraceae bacterium]